MEGVTDRGFSCRIHLFRRFPQCDALLLEWLKNAVCAAVQLQLMRVMVNTGGLEAELAFYGTYHTNKWNQLIHFIFVPVLWWSACLLKCFVPVLPLRLLGLGAINGHEITWGTVGLLSNAALYVRLNPFLGGITAALLLILYLHAAGAVAAERRRRGKPRRRSGGGGGSNSNIAVRADEKKKGKEEPKEEMSWLTLALLSQAVGCKLLKREGRRECLWF